MTMPDPLIANLADRIIETSRTMRRRLVAIAGAPASGKSTLAETLTQHLNVQGHKAMVVPMDGFHLDNEILKGRGMLERKGAPQTFDAQGFLHLVGRFHHEAEVFFPVFDRSRDLAVAGAGIVDPTIETVIVEGNYLLFDAPIWRELLKYWDLSIRLNVPPEVLRSRLVSRWVHHGFSAKQAAARADENDMANAQIVWERSAPADIEVSAEETVRS